MTFSVNFQMQIISICLSLLILFLFYGRKQLNIARENAFKALLWATLVSIILDIFASILVQNYTLLPMVFTDIVRRLYLISVVFVSFLILIYTLVEIYLTDIFKNKMRYFYLFPLIMSFPLSLFFSIRIATGHSSSFGYSVYAAMALTVVYISISWFYAIRYRNIIDRHRWNAIMFSGVVFFVCGLFQLFFQDRRLIDIGIAFVVLYMYLGLENPETYVDREVNAFNGNAFRIYVANNLNENSGISLLYLRLNDYGRVRETTGSEIASFLISEVADYLGRVEGAKCFFMGGSEFILSFEREAFFIDRVQKIRERFRSTWTAEINNQILEIELSISMVAYPSMRMVGSIEDITDTLAYFVNQISVDNNESFICIDRKQIREKKAYDHVKGEIKDAIAEHRIQVFYQPIFSANEGKCKELEALLRMRDKNDVFMNNLLVFDAAEKTGTVEELGYEIFRQICRFAASNDLKSAGIDKICINLSSMQCQQHNLASKLIDIMEGYNVSAALFRFEIPESAVAYFSQNLRRNINQLSSQGSSFSIDNYGDNYLTPDVVTTLTSKHIKIGRKTVSDYFKGKKSRQYMKIMCRMLQQLRMEITAAGVETQQQYAELKKLGISQIQGYAFYHPLPEDEVLKVLEKDHALGREQEVLFERVL